MPTSLRFRELRRRIVELRDHFLPKQFDPTGSYTPRQSDRARAFRLLAHAEIESYLEDVVKEAANVAFEMWRTGAGISSSLVAMIAFVDENLGAVPETKDLTGERELTKRIRLSRDKFNKYAFARNHGITERDVLKLLLPVGISEKDIDSTWLATIDSFGQSRGRTAHRSKRVDQPPDPRNEYEIVSQIIDGLMVIDQELLELGKLPRKRRGGK